MQASSGVNALLAVASPAPTASSGAAAVSDSGDEAASGSGQAFAELLGDFGAQAEGQSSQNPSGAPLVIAATATVLAAQEIGLDTITVTDETTPSPLQLVTPELAKDMLARMGAAAGKEGDAPADKDAVMQIKEQLQQIVRSDTPKTVAAMLEAAPAVKEGKLPAVIVAVLNAAKKTASSSQTEEAPNQALTAMQSLPATLFRPDMGEAAPAPTAAQPQKKKGRDFVETVTVVEPLAFAAVTTVADAANTEVDALAGRLSPRADLDQIIPPLKLEAQDQLPDIDLPKWTLPNQAANAREAMNGNAKMNDGMPAASKLREDLSALNGVSGADAGAPVTPQSYPSAVGAHAAMSAHAAKSLDMVATPGFINHALVTDQVKVAIHQASKDGLDRIIIQLDPIDLGRVEVNMQTNKEGVTQIFFTIDKPDTFDSLSRDARSLERSLQEAGVKADTGSMQFNLRQQPQPQMQSDLNGQGQPKQPQPEDEQESQHTSVTGVQALAALTRHYTVNIREGVDISA